MNRFWCGLCSKGFETAGGLRRHLRNQHPNDIITSHAFRPTIYARNGREYQGGCYICLKPRYLHLKQGKDHD